MNFLRVMDLPWMSAPIARIRSATASGRFPHAILLLAHAGLGAEALADFIAALLLCEGTEPRPCGDCASCVLLRADNHPDLHRVSREEDAQQVKVDQIRVLIDTLLLTSFRAGYKIGIIEQAESLNMASANSLLKTLEEPPERTLLVLVASRSHRLPATIVSRCQRLIVQRPRVDDALAWLARHGIDEESARAALALHDGSPIDALAADLKACASLHREMSATLQRLLEHNADPTRVAEAWLQSHRDLRLAWLETWITRQIREGLAPHARNVKSVDAVGLSASLLKAKIRPLFDLLGETRSLKTSIDSSLNVQLALESLLIRHFTGSKSAV